MNLSLMIILAKSVHFSDIYSKKCLKIRTIKMTVPNVQTRKMVL